MTRILHELAHETAALTPTAYHRDAFLELVEFLLWIYDRDLSYGDQGDYLLGRLHARAPEWLPYVEAAADPAAWSIARWAAATGVR